MLSTFSRPDAANTITTWVLPIIGLMVQAPYESNEAWETIFSIFRWAGSPIAALSYIFWNIKVTGKCALMVDMSTKYDEYPPEGSEFSYMRDSLYILCIMNQYTPKPSLPPVEAEHLLRLAIFSNLLQLKGSSDERDSLLHRRTVLARALREGRKKGVIPVFVSFLWFVFALVLSIELAFNSIGGNETAHDLAIGLLVGWLPVLIVACAVDRNLVSADAIREHLNELVHDVRLALLDPTVLQKYKETTNTGDEDFAWMASLGKEELFGGEFFVRFGGQGRTHFHYGVAHPLLSGIETKFMAAYGRDWLRHGYAARLAIVVGSRNLNGLKMFDPRMAWQITSAIVTVSSCSIAAFIISYFTPTVGLGCRSGGYLIYIVIALGLLTIELLIWWLTHTNTHTDSDILRRVGSRLERSISTMDAPKSEKFSRIHRHIHTFLHRIKTSSFRDLVKNAILRPGEAFNTAWLMYIIFAQTFGSYQTCECMSSNWAAGQGGYIDFSTYDVYVAAGVYVYWGAGTALSCFVMACGLIYIVLEYCTQSHISTEDYGRAMQGLRMTRWFRKHTRFIRFVPNHTIRLGKLLFWKLNGGRSRRGRRSLVWTEHTEHHVRLNAMP